MANARKIAVKALVRVNGDAAYSNITFLNILKETPDIPSADKSLAATLFYGVLDRRITLDYFLSFFIKTKIEKLPPVTREALRIAVYQIYFTDKIPESAAVNESVKIVKASKERYNVSFVNGVLRSLLRDRPAMPDGNDLKSLCIKYSCPKELVTEIINDYGSKEAEMFLSASLAAPKMYIRVNSQKTDCEKLVEILKSEGVTAERAADMQNALCISGGADISALKSFSDGMFHIEDLACQKSLERLSLKENERALDMCAAPGGKTFTMAQMLGGTGEVMAFDLYEQRAKLISDGAKRLGLSNVKAAVGDATVYNADLGLFDAVLCDVPCSGFGVIGRKPEIKYKPITDYTALEETQLKILLNADRYLRAGGRLLYSTCTVRKSENSGVVKAFLDKCIGYELQYEYTFLPHIDKTDGFYSALLVKFR